MKHQNYIIRPETPHDYYAVEALTREAFWNVYVPGCYEHYFVHVMRSHPDFVPELDYVLESGGKIVGSILAGAFFRTAVHPSGASAQGLWQGFADPYSEKSYCNGL